MNPSSENRRRLGMTKHKRSVLLSNASDIGLHPKAFARKSMKYPHAYFVQFSAIYFSGRTITFQNRYRKVYISGRPQIVGALE